MIIGALACLSAIFLINKNKANKINVRGWVFSILALVLIFFGAAWAQISVYENEIQAAIVGLLLFGGMGVVFGILSLKHIGVKLLSKSDTSQSKEGFSLKSWAIGALIIISSVLLFFTLFLNKAGTVLSDSESMADFVTEQVIADDVLPATIKKAVVYQIMYDYDGFEFKQRLMLAILGSVDEKEWVELFDMFIPESTRVELVKNATSALNDWIENDQPYPKLEIDPQLYTSEIKKNAKEIILWVYEATLFPPCDSAVLQSYSEGSFSNNLEDLIGCKPPQEYRDQLAEHAAILLTATVDSANIPALIRLQDKIAETMSAEEMSAQKKDVRKMRLVLRYIFLVPLILLVIGICIPIFSKLSFVKSMAWPTIISGIIGFILYNYFSNTQQIFDGIAGKIAESVPAPALAIIQNFMTGIIDKTLPLINVISIVSLLSGIVLLGLLYFNKFKGLFNKKGVAIKLSNS